MRRLAVAASLLLALAACSSSDSAATGDGGSDASFATPDAAGAALLEGGSLADAGARPRVTKHGGAVLGAMHVFAVYLALENADGGAHYAPSEDAEITWLVSSPAYWSCLAEYGVGDGTMLGSAIVSLYAVVPPSQVSGGLIAQKDFADGVAHLLHPAPGVDAGAAIPAADAYAFFLPSGANVVFPAGQGTTCLNAAGYHDDDGIEPFAVFPPCAAGRDTMALSHELAETATDPFGTGWYSDADYANGGGEIGDLCDQPASVSGHVVATLWSDAIARCFP